MERNPLVLLVQPVIPTHDYSTLLRSAGFRVETSPDDRISEPDVLAIGPDLIAVELEADRSTDTLDLARRLRADRRTRPIPVILYATRLEPEHIQSAAQAGIMWLQIGATDGPKLVAAIRGVLTRSPSQAEALKPADRQINVADLGVEARLTCPTCRSRISVIETASGGKTVSIVTLGASVESTAKALERFIAPDRGADIICPACEQDVEPSAQYRMHDRPLTRRH